MENKLVEDYCKRQIEKDGERYQEAKRRWLNGESLSSIEKDMHYNRRTISKLLKFEGYEVKTCGRKYTYNHHIFDKIDTEEKAYWLGFFYADAEISILTHYILRIGLKAEDRDHIAKMRDFIAPDVPIESYEALETKSKKYHRASRVTFSSKKLVEALIDKGCVPNKGQTLRIPFEHLSQDLIHHFIRGFFDGDGCCSLIENGGRLAVSFLSASKQIISEIRQILINQLEVNPNKLACYKRKPTSQPLYSFSNSAKADIKKIYNYLYNNATIYLERKKNTFDKVLNKQYNSRPETNSQESPEN